MIKYKMRCSSNILQELIIVIIIGSINGLSEQGETDHYNSATVNFTSSRPLQAANLLKAEHKIEESGLIKPDIPFATASFNENSFIDHDLKINAEEDKTVNQFKRHEVNDKNSLKRLIKKYIGQDISPLKYNKNCKESVDKIINKQTRRFSDINSDRANVNLEQKSMAQTARNDYIKHNTDNFSLLNKLLKLPYSDSVVKNSDAVFDKFFSVFDENALIQRNGIKQRIINRQPMYNGKKNELESVNDLEFKLANPGQENYLIDNVLNTQNFISYLKKTLNNTASMNRSDLSNNYNLKYAGDGINKYISKRHASLLSGERSHKKKHKINKMLDISGVKKNSTKIALSNEDNNEAIDVATGKPSKKQKLVDESYSCDKNSSSEGVSECTTACSKTIECSTTCETWPSLEITEICEPSSVCEESTTECQITTSCEETTACDMEVFEPPMKPKKHKISSKTSCPVTTCPPTTCPPTTCPPTTCPPTTCSSTTCPTTCPSTTCPPTTCPTTEEEEEEECEEETTECATTVQCKTTQPCNDPEIVDDEIADESQL